MWLKIFLSGKQRRDFRVMLRNIEANNRVCFWLTWRIAGRLQDNSMKNPA
jgi:hypothetical protein